jgi:hypothetical protein
MTLLKLVIVLLCFLFLLGLSTVICLELYYSSNLPRVADKQEGFVYQMVVNHGFIVYGTKGEFRLLGVAREWLPVACICGLAAGVLNFKYKAFSLPCGACMDVAAHWNKNHRHTRPSIYKASRA